MGGELEHRFSEVSHAPLPRRLRGYDVEATDALIDELPLGGGGWSPSVASFASRWRASRLTSPVFGRG